MTEHPGLRKGRCRSFVSIKDNNVGKKLSAASISWWICTTIVDSHAALKRGREGQSPGGPCCGYFFITFQKVDLQAVMKPGRWSSGGTFTSFYLRDLCLQADSIRKTGPVLAAGEIMEIS